MSSKNQPAGFRIHERFAKALRDAPPEIVERIWKVIEQIRRDPQSVRSLKGCKKVKGALLPLLEARIEGDWRLIWMNQPNGEPYLLMAGDHDHVFSSAIRKMRPADLDESPAVSVGAHSGEGKLGPSSADYGRALRLNLPFERISDSMFEYWDVPKPLVPVIRGLEDENGIAGLIGEIPDAVIDAILEFVKDGTIRRRRGEEEATASEVLLAHTERPSGSDTAVGEYSPLGLTRELLLSIGVPETAVPSILVAQSVDDLEKVALPFRVAQRLIEAISLPGITGVAADAAVDLYAANEQDLQDYYKGDIRRLLFYLQPAQQAIVDLPTPGVHLVKGVAGSGKSTVALYRAKRILTEDPEARVLFLTFSKTLARTAAELAGELMPLPLSKRLTVTNVSRWMANFVRDRRPGIEFVSANQRLVAIKASVEQVRERGPQSRLFDRPPEWFDDEIAHSIQGRALTQLDEYLGIERSGRETSLAEAGRRIVWQVFEAYRGVLGERYDWEDLPLLCLDELKTAPVPEPRPHVIVDEGQDLSPATMRVCAALTSVESPSVLLLADAAQSIYRRGFRWKDIGLSVHGSHVHRLGSNYRNTLEILRLTNGFLERTPDLREDGEEGALERNTHRRGPMPLVLNCAGSKAEAEAIARRILALNTERGVPFGNIAVFARWNKRIDYIAYILRNSGIPCALHTDDGFTLGNDCVKLATLHSAKGLEFPVVFVADVLQGVLPLYIISKDDEAERAEAETARRLFYVGMTRAMQELYITTVGHKRSPLFDELPKDRYREVREAQQPTAAVLA